MNRYVMVGASAAGVTAAETLRRYDPNSEIVMVSDERVIYSRPLLSYYLAGKLNEEQLLYRPRDFFERYKIKALFTRAVGLDPEKSQVHLQDGSAITYDKLLLATGASPRFPAIEGIRERAGVFGLRKLEEDAKAILSWLPQARRAVVLGGGLVGLKAAAALKERGLNVTVLVDSPHALSQMLDESSARIFEGLFERNGVPIRTKAKPVALLGKKNVEGVQLASGEVFPCDLVIVGKGVDPNLELLQDTKLRKDYGVLVDDHLRTSVENIYAAGDVAQVRDVVRGEPWINALWPCAVEQGRIAALNMLGRETRYRGSMRMNSVQFFGVPVISAGLAVLTPGPLGGRSGEHDETLESRPAPGIYRKIFLKDDTIVGFVLVGEVPIEAAGLLRILMDRRVNVADVKEELLELGPDLGYLLPLIAQNREHFVEREFQELVQTVGV
ncbi:MAG: FAD-dependent oxidoreductase [Candidatus Bipolaricaulota bacterium]|nr:FAD-dependent oxidoreductase [Candidatus Bipolaricaulota bacterium]